MKTIFLVAGLGAITVTRIALAQPGAPMRPDADVTRQQVIQRVDAQFDRLDQDRDGRATREEAMAMREQRRSEMADRMFARLDLDGNGSITREEMRDARERRAEQGMGPGRGPGMGPGRGPGMGMRRGPGGPGGPAPRMRMRGFGEQGFITREQMRERALARFDRLDGNRDGTVTGEERRAARERFRDRRRMRSSDES